MNTVEAVKNQSDAETISRKLTKNAKGNTLYADIWRFGVNTALPVSYTHLTLPTILLV